MGANINELLTEVTVIYDEELQWDSLKQKKGKIGNCCPISGNEGKRAKGSKKKHKSACLHCAEKFFLKVFINQEKTKGGYRDFFVSVAVKRATT